MRFHQMRITSYFKLFNNKLAFFISAKIMLVLNKKHVDMKKSRQSFQIDDFEFLCDFTHFFDYSFVVSLIENFFI